MSRFKYFFSFISDFQKILFIFLLHQKNIIYDFFIIMEFYSSSELICFLNIYDGIEIINLYFSYIRNINEKIIIPSKKYLFIISQINFEW